LKRADFISSDAVALPAITVRADKEHRVTFVTEAKSLPEYRFAMNRRHASWQARLDNGSRFVARLEPVQFGFTCPMVAEPGTLPL
jgi:hypothetical protein